MANKIMFPPFSDKSKGSRGRQTWAGRKMTLKKKFSFAQIFLLARSDTHSCDLKKQHQMCLCLLCTSPHFHSVVFLSLKYMHEQSYFTQFYDIKKRTRRKKKEAERTFDIYSFLFIFIISFSLNSFSRTRKIAGRTTCRGFEFAL